MSDEDREILERMKADMDAPGAALRDLFPESPHGLVFQFREDHPLYPQVFLRQFPPHRLGADIERLRESLGTVSGILHRYDFDDTMGHGDLEFRMQRTYQRLIEIYQLGQAILDRLQEQGLRFNEATGFIEAKTAGKYRRYLVDVLIADAWPAQALRLGRRHPRETDSRTKTLSASGSQRPGTDRPGGGEDHPERHEKLARDAQQGI